MIFRSKNDATSIKLKIQKILVLTVPPRMYVGIKSTPTRFRTISTMVTFAERKIALKSSGTTKNGSKFISTKDALIITNEQRPITAIVTCEFLIELVKIIVKQGI